MWSAYVNKQTSLWKMKDGTKIRICDMEDSHLINTIKMIDRYCLRATQEAVWSGYAVLNSFCSPDSMASYQVESDIARLEEEGIDPFSAYPIYGKLWDDLNRRGLEV